MNFAAYYRVSTEGSDSITTQRTLLREWAAGAGHTIAAEYEDEAVSGGVPVAERPGSGRMLADLQDKRRGFDALLVIRADRLCRDLYDQLGVMRLLARCRCPLWTPQGPVTWESPTDQLTGSILAAVAQFERQLTGLRIKEKNTARALAGDLPAGYPPMGLSYDGATKAWGVTERAGDINTLFSWALETQGNVCEVARRAGQAGIKGTRGGGLTATAVSKLLRNPLYRGRAVYGGTEYPMAGVPEVVPRRLVEAVVTLLGTVQAMPTRARQGTRAYSGLLYCAACGGRLHSRANTPPKQSRGHADAVLSWTCANREFGICAASRISQRYLDRLIGQALAILLDHCTTGSAEPVASVVPAHVADRRIALHRQRMRWAELYAEGVVDAATMRARVAVVDAELRALPEEPPAPVTATPEDLRQLVALAGQDWGSIPEPERRAVLLALGATITVTSTPDDPRAVCLATPYGTETAGFAIRYRRRGKGRRAT